MVLLGVGCYLVAGCVAFDLCVGRFWLVGVALVLRFGGFWCYCWLARAMELDCVFYMVAWFALCFWFGGWWRLLVVSVSGFWRIAGGFGLDLCCPSGLFVGNIVLLLGFSGDVSAAVTLGLRVGLGVLGRHVCFIGLDCLIWWL